MPIKSIYHALIKLELLETPGHGTEFKKMLIDNGKLEGEKEEEKKPAYGSSSSSEDSSASDENDDSDKAFLDAAEKGMLHFD